jgi:hypothetical protein
MTPLHHRERKTDGRLYDLSLSRSWGSSDEKMKLEATYTGPQAQHFAEEPAPYGADWPRRY